MTERRRRSPGIPAADRLGLSRVEAAQYIGISPNTFDEMVADGRMPPAKMIGARRVWSRVAVERAFEELPETGGKRYDSVSKWDAVAV